MEVFVTFLFGHFALQALLSLRFKGSSMVTNHRYVITENIIFIFTINDVNLIFCFLTELPDLLVIIQILNQTEDILFVKKHLISNQDNALVPHKIYKL